jgi:transcription initiation factor TFIID TATA-box-binding protein
MAKYKITNLVASADLGIELDLYQLPLKFKNIEYEPEQFPGAILKFNNPKATLLLFKNGRTVIVGCKDKKLIKEALARAYKMLFPYSKKISKKLDEKNIKFEITNIVAAGDVEMKLDLFKLAMNVEEDIEYEPEQFPGAVLRFRNPPISLLIFRNGKLIIAGAKSKEEIEKILERTEKIVKKYQEK